MCDAAPQSRLVAAPGSAPSRWTAWVAIEVVGIVFVALTVATWRRWPDLVVDFGTQLYIPWRISQGAVLYRDLAYLVGGPLSQYYHALLFSIFGVSFLTVALSNLAVLAMMLAIMYRCFYRCADQLTALAICLAVLTAFAFAQYTDAGVFNYIAPYSAEIVHGLALSLLTVALLARWIEQQQPRLAAAAGLCGGLTLLTKPDIFAALVLAFIAATAIFWRVRRDGRVLGRSLAWMAGAGMIAPAGFVLWFLRFESLRESLRSVIQPWVYLHSTPVLAESYYQWCLGLDQPQEHLLQAGIHFAVLAAIAAVCALVSLRKIPGPFQATLSIAVGFALIGASWSFNWIGCGACLPCVCLTLLALLLWRLAVGKSESGWVFALLWAFWSLVLLVKLGFFWRIWHYGFVLAMPAFVSGIYLFLWELPRHLQRWAVRPLLFRTLMALALATGLVQLTRNSLGFFSIKTVPVGWGSDMMLACDPRFAVRDFEVAAALRWVQENVPPGATMSVLPNGSMLNYLSRHPNPGRYTDWNPLEMMAFGHAKMTEDLMEHSPDYLVLIFATDTGVNQSSPGLEKRFTGELMDWINAHYKQVWRAGHDWLIDGQFGIKILKKNG